MPDLAKRPLGRTGLDVTVLGYGAMELRQGHRAPHITEEHAERVLNTVLDCGINYLDTSIDYGLSEERIGRAIAHRRVEYFLASKCGCLPDGPEGPNRRLPHVYTRANIVAGVEQSLQRLRTDYLDVVQFHQSPSRQELEAGDAVGALQDLQRQGKVRFLGISATLPNVTDQLAMGTLDVFQVPYSAIQREHEDVLTQIAEAGAGVVVRGGTGRDALGRDNADLQSAWQQAGMDDLLGGMSRTEFVLRFSYSHPAVDTLIVGTANPDHVRANVDTILTGPLPADVYAEAKRRLATMVAA